MGSPRNINREVRRDGRDKLFVRGSNLNLVDINVVIVVARSALALHSRTFVCNMESIEETIVVDMTLRNRRRAFDPVDDILPTENYLKAIEAFEEVPYNGLPR
jgi:hypothetical protein